VDLPPEALPDPLQPGTVWKGWITQRGTSFDAAGNPEEVPPRWTAEMRITSRNGEQIEGEASSRSEDGKFKGKAKFVGTFRPVTVGWKDKPPEQVEYNLEVRSTEVVLEGPNAKTAPSVSRVTVAGGKIKGTWYIKDEGKRLDVEGELEYTLVPGN
jgi:hypothetical protein